MRVISFFLLYLPLLAFAQRGSWLLPMQEEWQMPGNVFIDKNGKKASFSIEERRFVPFLEQNIEKKDSFLLNYDSSYELGKLGYLVYKYNMRAVISKENKLIFPFSESSPVPTVYQDSLFKIKQYDREYIYDKKGKLVQTINPNQLPQIDVLQVRYLEDYLFDYDKRETISEKYINLVAARDLKNTFVAIRNNLHGVINEKNKAILPFDYQALTYVSDSVLIAFKNNKYGLIHLNGKVILPFSSEKLEAYRNGIIVKIYDYEKVEAYLTNGKRIGSKMYKNALKTDDNIIFCSFDYKKGFIYDSTATLINHDTLVEIWFVDNPKINKLAHYARTKTGWGLQKKDGTWLVPPFCKERNFVDDNFLKINQKDIEKFGINGIEKKDAPSDYSYYFTFDFQLFYPKPCKIERFEPLKDTFLIHNGYRKLNLIDKNGKLIFKKDYTYLRGNREPFMFYLQNDSSIELIYKNGKQILFEKDSVISMQYAGNGLILIIGKGYKKRGVIDTNGTKIIPLINCDFLEIKNKLIEIDSIGAKSLNVSGLKSCFSCKEKRYLLDLNKKAIIETPAQIDYYTNKYLIYSANGKVGILDPFGKILLEAKYDYIQKFTYEKLYFIVMHEKQLGIIDFEE